MMKNNVQTLSRSAIMSGVGRTERKTYRLDGLKEANKSESNVVYLSPDDLEALHDLAETSHVHELKYHKGAGRRGVFHSVYKNTYLTGLYFSGDSNKKSNVLKRLAAMSGIVSHLADGCKGGFVFECYSGGYKYDYLSGWYLILPKTGEYGDRMPKTVKALAQFYDKVKQLPTECSEAIYQQYKDTGVYYTGSEMTINGKKVRYMIPVSQAARLAYNTLETKNQKQITNQEEEKAWQKNYQALQAGLEAQEKSLDSIKERYESQIMYSKILRYGLVGVMAVVAIAGIVWGIVVATKKK